MSGAVEHAVERLVLEVDRHDRDRTRERRQLRHATALVALWERWLSRVRPSREIEQSRRCFPDDALGDELLPDAARDGRGALQFGA
jgi:hypothetical protein